MKKFTCKKCGSHDLIETQDGIWSKTYWNFNTTLGKYEDVRTKYDGNGEHSFECEECGEAIKNEDKVFEMLVNS